MGLRGAFRVVSFSLVVMALPALRFGLGQTTQPAPRMTDRAAARFLDQATWGPTPDSIQLLQSIGIPDWLTMQFSTAASDLPDQPALNADGKPDRDLRPLQRQFFQNAVTGPDQLRQRVAFALSEIWVVSGVELPFAYAYPPYMRIFSENAFGNYRDIVKGVTLSPAMGRYLNMANNNKGNPVRGTSANENYARELMQLFTLGLVQLNPDGSPVLDQNGTAAPTYDQDVVTNVARVLTGWTYPTAPSASARPNNPPYFIGQMFAVERNHDTDAKTIFGGVRIPAGQTAETELDMLLDALMQQRTMAPFVCRQLIQHLVTSNPSRAYLERVSNAFLDNGAGVRGDMKAVIIAILTDPEARADDDGDGPVDANFGHLREPVLFMTGVLRGLNATLGDSSAVQNSTNAMGQNLFYPPSVFSYFSPQYKLPKGLFGPEFQIYSTQTAAARANIVNALVFGTLDRSTRVNMQPFVDRAGSIDGLLDFISYVFLHDNMSAGLRRAAYDAANAVPNPLSRARAALYITLTSPEYQIVR